MVVTESFLQEQPLSDVAARLGVTESRISQLRTEALRLLREGLNSSLAPELLTVAAGGPRSRKGCLQRRRTEYFQRVAEQGNLRTRLASDRQPRRADRGRRVTARRCAAADRRRGRGRSARGADRRLRARRRGADRRVGADRRRVAIAEGGPRVALSRHPAVRAGAPTVTGKRRRAGPAPADRPDVGAHGRGQHARPAERHDRRIAVEQGGRRQAGAGQQHRADRPAAAEHRRAGPARRAGPTASSWR